MQCAPKIMFIVELVDVLVSVKENVFCVINNTNKMVWCFESGWLLSNFSGLLYKGNLKGAT